MPKLTEKLTDAVMKRLPVPPKGNVLYYDPELKGFAGRVTAAAARSFVLVYTFQGAERRDTIGEFPAWTTKAARTVAEDWRRDARRGIDPRGEPETEAATFKARAEAFLEHGRRKRGLPLRPSTVREYRRALRVYAKSLHDRQLSDIKRGEIAAVIQRVAKEHGEVSAMRCRAALGRLWTWSIAAGFVESNSVVGTEGYATGKRSRVLTDAELTAIWQATAEPGDFSMIIKMCMWTGCRRSEAGGMRWSELDGGVWTVPGGRTKNGRELALPLPRQTMAALAAWPRTQGRDHLFGRGPNGFQAWSQSKARLDAKLDFDRSWTPHDLRRTVETRMAGLGIPKEHVNKVLNHADGPVTAAYDHWSYLPEKAAALQAWADTLERIVGEGTPNVLPIRRSAS
jgi:integrase